MKWTLLFGAGWLAVCGGCKQHRTVPVSEASKLGYLDRPPSGEVVVTDIEGQSVYIESFRTVVVQLQRCYDYAAYHELYCYVRNVDYRTPMHLEVSDDQLLVVPSPEDRRHPEPERYTIAPARVEVEPDKAAYVEGVKNIRLVDRSAGRTWTILVTSVMVGVSAIWATYEVAKASDAEQAGVPFGILFTAPAAVGASLLITVPLTRDLGTVE